MTTHSTDPGDTLVSPGSVASGADRRARVGHWYAVVLVGLLLAALARAHIVETFFVPDAGMAPTLAAGDRVVVAKFGGQPEVGDVVVVDVSAAFPGPSRATHTDDGPVGSMLAGLAEALGVRNGSRSIVARVLAGPSDVISCRDGQIAVNTVPVPTPGPLPAGVDCAGLSVTVPPGAIWVLGDNPGAAFDSLAHVADPGQGVVHDQDVIGRVLLRVWPLSTVGSP